MTIYEESPNLEARALVDQLRAAEADERCNDSMCDYAADALTAALDRAEKAEAEAERRGRMLADLAQTTEFEVAYVGGYHVGWNVAIEAAATELEDGEYVNTLHEGDFESKVFESAAEIVRALISQEGETR